MESLHFKGLFIAWSYGFSDCSQLILKMAPSNKSRNLLEGSSSVVLKHEKGFYCVSEVKRLVDTNPG